ncbi:MAG TPA: lipocalin family protein [Armatimonadota bacterium]|jgi:hypothetical protein
MRLRSITVFVLAAALALAGCSKPTIVGTWKGAASDNSEVKIALTLTKDAKFKQTTDALNMGAQHQSVTTGTYTAGNGTLTLTVASLMADGMQFPAPDHSTSTWTYKLEGDKLTISPMKSQAVIVLKRARD